MLSFPLQVCLLLKHHADHHLKNHEGQEPLDIAVANSDADIVTLLRYTEVLPCLSTYRLRLAALNEEIREADMTLHDDTFNDVVQVESLFKFDLLNFKVIPRAGVQQDGLHSPGEASKEIASCLRRFAKLLHLH